MEFADLIRKPWPWYVSGPLIGLMVPLLLIMDNKRFGISSSLRHMCAAWFPSGISYFRYNWKKESWNLFFAGGILAGGFITGLFLTNNEPVDLNPALINQLKISGMNDFTGLMPNDLFSWSNLFSLQGLLFVVAGGFFVGFGTRYAGGCTSGHSIMGLSNLQWPSLVATICFMVGGFLVANLVVPNILRW